MIVLGQCSGNCFYGLFETFKSDLRHSLPILPCLKGCTVTLYRQAQLSLAHDSFGTMFWQLFLWLVRNFQIWLPYPRIFQIPNNYRNWLVLFRKACSPASQLLAEVYSQDCICP